MMKFVKALKMASTLKSDLLTEQYAAVWLDTSIYTLRRERKRGNIGFTMIGSRARYSTADLQAYVDSKSSTPCPKTVFKSEPTTSPGTKAPLFGKPLGMTPIPDKQSAYLLAQKTFKKPKSA
ncbi:helix-turn-helix domain-containing protein [Mesorhizobium sp. KR1-2]|uniref:helix-turn-helix domain-containing protein n=1 Tax=Mesorhizobium sp. KR1-2 TaxID=3156609 RepID=UPI0032B54814